MEIGQASIQLASGPTSGSTRAQPASLNSRLPRATRRPAAFCRLLLSRARTPLPRLAPITRQSATLREITLDAARVAVSSTAARLE
ncbi:hypothetical protein D3C81_1518540 [compost metagenome]